MFLVLGDLQPAAAQNIFPSTGKVGIGTTTPDVPLKITQDGGSVSGSMNLSMRVLNGAGSRGVFLGYDDSGTIGVIGAEQYNGNLSFWTNSPTDGWAERMRLSSQGFLTIGSSVTDTPLKILKDGLTLSGTTKLTFRMLNSAGTRGVFLGYDDSGTVGVIGTEQANGSLAFWTYNSTGGGWGERMRLTNTGMVGIGTTAPSAMFHVAGNVQVDGNIGAKYQDVAEWVKTPTALPPGTVVVIDGKAINSVVPSDRPYDTRVVGVVSSKPGILLGEPSENATKVAQSGRVKVKVDASYGPVAIGDLLVTSKTPGHAMRSEPVSVGGAVIHQPGTLLGKALESLQEGQGEILILLTLQ
jgi:hypothetical protein